MSRDPHKSAPPRWQPTWRRVATGSVGAFVVVLGFLAGRMNGGADPGLASSARHGDAATSVHATTTKTQSTTTTTGTAAPTTQTVPQQPTQVAQDPSPPTTHSS
jgi:hypothetical protein